MAPVRDAEPRPVHFDARVARLATAQHGAFAREQLARIGATRGLIESRLRTGRWERIFPDVFRLAGAPVTWRQGMIATCLAWGVGAAASHRAAALVWRVASERVEPELTVPRTRSRNGPGIVHRAHLLPADVTVVDAIPVTTPARTLLDVATVLPIERVEEALDEALRRGLVSVARMRALLRRSGGRGRPGTRAIRALLDARDPSGVMLASPLERRLLRILQRARLPDLVLQHRIRSAARTVAVVDFAFPAAKLAVEADGARYHSGRRQWERDLARRNRLMLLGWRSMHVTWSDLKDPEALVSRIRAALHASP